MDKDNNKNNEQIFKGQVDWKLKLKAILHDPPYKAEDIEKHKEQAYELINILVTDNKIDEEINTADRIASAQSRIIVKPDLKGDQKKKTQFEKSNRVVLEEAKFIDIFTGNEYKVELPDSQKLKTLFKTLSQKINEFNDLEYQEKLKLIFLFLWRFYPEIFKGIGKSPADTRAPNHSIYDHLVQTSAITSALKYNNQNTVPSFLLFTIGPIQSFISKSRKTSDLWAGSYMLSYLIWKTMEPLVDHFGPDIIIFPNLLNQPLVDKYLFDKYFKNLVAKNENFKDSDNQIFKEWYEKCEILTGTDKENKESKKQKEIIELEEKLTIANFPNRFLAIIPYDISISIKCEEIFKNQLINLAEKVYSKIGIQSKQLKEKIKNQLLSYFQVYWVVMPWGKDNKGKDVKSVLNDYEKIVSSDNELYQTVKEIINHPYYSSANVGSAYSLLLELTEKLLGSRKSVRDFIQSEQRGIKCNLCGEFDALHTLSNEKLCGVCLTKRFFPKVIQEELGLSEEIRFPSTSEMATIETKLTLNDDVKQELRDKFYNLRNKLLSSISVPKLKGDKLYDIDGQFLMEETYAQQYLEREYGINFNDKLIENLEEIENFLKENNINPTRYYAILHMDGDNMGKWLKGEFNPKIKDTIHDKVINALLNFSQGEDKQKIQKILCSKHPVSPSIHQAFSRRLSTFSLNIVRKIVEEKHYGKLVYSGGDDVLAFLPVGKALNCAYELQKEFKNLLGNKASMSAGILFVHHKYPLYLALKRVEQAEKDAKKIYQRNSFCVVFLTHSGTERKFGSNWDLMDDFLDLICKFKNEEISSNFPYQFLEIVEKLYTTDSEKNSNSLQEVLRIELKRLFFRKEGSNELRNYFENKILNFFDKFYISNIMDFCNLLIIARKIAQELKSF